tara:strand:- start:227 stop:433 length:207 start_codon:yes stop_codon:yes gene_type:complete
MSMAVAKQLGLSFNIEIIKQPDPVPISKILNDLLIGIYFNACSTICSDSGLGIRVELFTKNLYFQKNL